MSAEIKPGQIWAWQDTYDAKGPHGTTFEIVEGGTDVTYQYRDAAGFDPEQMYAAHAELVRANANLVRCICRAVGTEGTCAGHSGTPAPLDPGAVKAGDTVTLVGAHGTELSGPVEKVVRHTDGSLGFWVNQMTFYLGEFWTLTAHTPAPEPEPEWKPGTTGTAMVVTGDAADPRGRVFRKVRGMVVHRAAPVDDDMFVTTEGEMWALEGRYCKDFVPDEPRPLPTWAEIHNAIAVNLPADIDSLRKMTDGINALLRGESR